MGHNDIGNPFKLISATEALLVAWEARVYNPPPDMPESRLASLRSHRLSQLESRIDRASSQWPRSTTAPGQDYVESSPDSESELIEEYRQVHAQLLSEFERLRSEHISRYGSCISTGLATDRLVAVYAQVRDCMAACLHAAMINKERSENVDKSIAMAALRYINGYSGIHMNWPIAIDVHNTARLLSVVPDDDEMPLSDTAIA